MTRPMQSQLADKRCVYSTPIGTFDTYEEAVAACKRCDFDADACIEIKRPNYSDAAWEFCAGQEPIKLSFNIRVF